MILSSSPPLRWIVFADAMLSAAQVSRTRSTPLAAIRATTSPGHELCTRDRT